MACSAKPSTSGTQMAKLDSFKIQELSDKESKPNRSSKISNKNTEPKSKSNESQEVVEIDDNDDDDDDDKKPLKILITKIKDNKIEISCALCQSKILYDIVKFDENARQNSLEIICDCFEKVRTKPPTEAVSVNSNKKNFITIRIYFN